MADLSESPKASEITPEPLYLRGHEFSSELSAVHGDESRGGIDASLAHANGHPREDLSPKSEHCSPF